MSEKVKKFLCYTVFLIILYVITIWVFNVEIKGIASDKGAALATMYGWMGTVFAGFIALFLFTDWKDQHNKTIISAKALHLFEKFHNERDFIYLLETEYEKNLMHPNEFMSNFTSNYNSLIQEFHNFLSENENLYAEFTFLIEGEYIHGLITEYRIAFANFIKETNEFRRLNTKFIDTQETYKPIAENLKTKNFLVLQELKNYIFMR